MNHYTNQMLKKSHVSRSKQSVASDRIARSWVQAFCLKRGNELFCEVDADYIQDDFNLIGLHNIVPFFQQSKRMILDQFDSTKYNNTQLYSFSEGARLLYGLIHLRFILTTKGLLKMAKKHVSGHFGICPRVKCNKQKVVPVGLHDNIGESNVRLYCPKCNNVYEPPHSRHKSVDGGFFGTTFPHLFLLEFPKFRKFQLYETFTPKIFGFKIRKPDAEPKKEEQPKPNMTEPTNDNRNSLPNLLPTNSTVKNVVQ
ncbi:hypothetical protein PCE1_004124 [Barthelona sp. PCE]